MIQAGQIGSRGSFYTDWEDTWHTDLEEPNDIEWNDKGRNVISQIYVSFDEVIRSIQFVYMEKGALVLSEKYGPSDGHNFRVLRLNQDEYMTGLSGVVVGQGLFQTIKSLTFRTNRGEQMIGSSNDNCASDHQKVDIDLAICDPREFGGFFGSYSISGLTSIGMYLNPIVGSSSQNAMVIKDEHI